MDRMILLEDNRQVGSNISAIKIVGFSIDFPRIAMGCGYRKAIKVKNEEELEKGVIEVNIYRLI